MMTFTLGLILGALGGASAFSGLALYYFARRAIRAEAGAAAWAKLQRARDRLMQIGENSDGWARALARKAISEIDEEARS